jgi:hypothetical protein
MASILKVIGTEITLNTVTSNNVSNATLARLINTSNDTNVSVTLQNSDATANLASFTLGFAGSDESVVYLKKDSSERILVSANSLVKAVSVAYF